MIHRFARTHARALAAPLFACFALGLCVSGCGSAEDAVDSAGEAAKSQAAAQASKAADAAKAKAAAKASQAADAAKRKAAQEARELATARICAIVGDGVVSAPDLAKLRTLLGGARAAGVPADLLSPVQQVVASGDAKSKQAVAGANRAKAACA